MKYGWIKINNKCQCDHSNLGFLGRAPQNRQTKKEDTIKVVLSPEELDFIKNQNEQQVNVSLQELKNSYGWKIVRSIILNEINTIYYEMLNRENLTPEEIAVMKARIQGAMRVIDIPNSNEYAQRLAKIHTERMGKPPSGASSPQKPS